ncbi:hypothetical protein E2C01_093102 [Portunus trituberculatus]|uniref:Uncharacterized protein n=1 Tax=Portunus trituberculatus TaxID=210409 RepID=A0A5B7JLX6_PORTR|nr:hypothetical protein [Portunus trituberculatus]
MWGVAEGYYDDVGEEGMEERVCVGVASGAVRRRAGGLAGDGRVGQIVLASAW